MFIYIFFLILNSILNSESAYVSNDKKCSARDEACLKSLFLKVFNDMVTNGIPEIGLAPIEPFKLKNESITFGEGLKLTIDEGTLSGFTSCVYEKYQISLENKVMTHSVKCKLIKVGVDISLSGSNALLQNILGAPSLDGHGTGNVDVDDISFNLEIPFKIVKNDAGSTYLLFNQKQNKHGHDIGKVTFMIEKAVIANQDFSTLLNQLMNENWKLFVESFDKEIIEKVLDYYVVYGVKKLYDGFPAEVFFTEDFSAYAK